MFGPSRHDSDWIKMGPTELQEPDFVGDLAALFAAREQARCQHMKLRAERKVREALYRKTIPTKESKPLGTWVWLRRSLERDWIGPGRITESLDWECAVRINNRYFSARHEDCLPLTLYEKEVHEVDEKEQLEDGPEAQPEVQTEASQERQAPNRVVTWSVQSQVNVQASPTVNHTDHLIYLTTKNVLT